MSEIIAYTIPYATYRLLLCLRCAKTYPEGPDKLPETVRPAHSFCDKCWQPIRKTEER